jgi:ketosteroid isomerase-like protein
MGTVADNARAGYDEFNRRDFEALLARMTEDFTWQEAPEVPGSPQSVGSRADFAHYLRTLGEFWERFSFEVLETAETEDTLYARVILHGRGKRSGADVALQIHHVWRLRDGLFANMQAYMDGDDAREAAGLEHDAV